MAAEASRALRAFEAVTGPFDVVRRSMLQLATRSASLTRVLARRDSRVTVLATLQVTVLFLLAATFPVALFFVGPVLFGVPHLAADVRYLVLRRASVCRRRPWLVVSAGIAIGLTLVRVSVESRWLTAPTGDTLDVAIGVSWVLLAAFAAIGAGARREALVWLPPALALAAFLVAHARAVGAVLVHAHNVMALVVWLALFRARRSAALLPLAFVAALTLLIASGSLVPWAGAHGGLEAFGVTASSLGAWIAPGFGPERGAALVTTFVFLQAVHYAVWTGWIPQDARESEGTPTFRMTARGLARDFGVRGLVLVASLTVALAAFAVYDVRRALLWYLTLARSHAWLECAFLVYLLLVRQEDRESASDVLAERA